MKSKRIETDLDEDQEEEKKEILEEKDQEINMFEVFMDENQEKEKMYRKE